MITSKKHVFTILLLIQRVYSEELVSEVLNQIKDEAVDWNKKQTIRFVKNWGELKDYPMSWSLSVNEA